MAPTETLSPTVHKLRDDFDPARYERIVADVRAHHGRLTSARAAIITTLLRAEHHVTADDLVAIVQATHPDVHLSTVYRTLEALESIGIVDHVHLGHGRAIYHLTDEAHQHLACEACGEVIEIPDAMFAELRDAIDRSYGFTIRPNHFAVLGRCSTCR